MTTTRHANETLEQIAHDIQRVSRTAELRIVRETVHSALERAGELALDYRTRQESRFVAEQARSN